MFVSSSVSQTQVSDRVLIVLFTSIIAMSFSVNLVEVQFSD